MLVLTRREGESVKIGDDIVITVFKFNAEESQVKIGIEAPRRVNIVRGEISRRRHGRGNSSQKPSGSRQ